MGMAQHARLVSSRIQAIPQNGWRENINPKRRHLPAFRPRRVKSIVNGTVVETKGGGGGTGTAAAATADNDHTDVNTQTGTRSARR